MAKIGDWTIVGRILAVPQKGPRIRNVLWVGYDHEYRLYNSPLSNLQLSSALLHK